MDRVCTVHIGLHKTGSTTIQSMLAAEEGTLRKYGFYFPKAGRNSSAVAHHLLAWELNHRPGFTGSEHFDALAHELDVAGYPGRIVLSSEDFSTRIHSPRAIGRLRKKIERLGYRLRVLAYIRPQETAVHSMYTQRSKMLRIDGDFDTFWPHAITGLRFDYEKRLDCLINRDDVELSVLPFGRKVIAEGLCRHFLKAIGVPREATEGFVEPAPANVSPGPKTIAASVAIRRELQKRGIALSRQTREGAAHLMRLIGEADGSDTSRFNALTAEAAASIRAYFRESNARFAQRVFGRSWEEAFADDTAEPGELNMFEPATISGEERHAFDELVANMTEAILELEARSEAAPADRKRRRI